MKRFSNAWQFSKDLVNSLYDTIPSIEVPEKYVRLAKVALDAVSTVATLNSLNYVMHFQTLTRPDKGTALLEDYGLLGVLAGETFSDILPSSDKLTKIWNITKKVAIPATILFGIIPFAEHSTIVYYLSHFNSLYLPIIGSDYSFLVAWLAQWTKNRISYKD